MSDPLNACVTVAGDDDCRLAIKAALEGPDRTLLPLQSGVIQGGVASDKTLAVSVGAPERTDTGLSVRLDVFYEELIAGCNCDSDPFGLPVHCVMQLTLDGGCEPQIEIIRD